MDQLLEKCGLTLEDDADLVSHVQRNLMSLYHLPEERITFPGALPIALDQEKLSALAEHVDEYVVTAKSDGLRLFLYLFTNPKTGKPVSIFIDRAFRLYRLMTVASLRYYERFGTLVDGEQQAVLAASGVAVFPDGAKVCWLFFLFFSFFFLFFVHFVSFFFFFRWPSCVLRTLLLKMKQLPKCCTLNMPKALMHYVLSWLPMWPS